MQKIDLSAPANAAQIKIASLSSNQNSSPDLSSNVPIAVGEKLKLVSLSSSQYFDQSSEAARDDANALKPKYSSFSNDRSIKSPTISESGSIPISSSSPDQLQVVSRVAKSPIPIVTKAITKKPVNQLVDEEDIFALAGLTTTPSPAIVAKPTAISKRPIVKKIAEPIESKDASWEDF